MNYFWSSGRKTERRAKRQDSWAFRDSQNFEMIGGHYEKEVIYPKNTTKAQGKLRNVHGWHWKSLNEKSHPHFSGGGKAVKLKAWKLLWGPGLRRLQQFMREDPVRLMLLIYLWGGPASWYVLSSEASKGTRMCNFHLQGVFIPLHSWLMNETRKGKLLTTMLSYHGRRLPFNCSSSTTSLHGVKTARDAGPCIPLSPESHINNLWSTFYISTLPEDFF